MKEEKLSPSSWEVTPSDRYIIDIGETEFPILDIFIRKEKWKSPFS